MESSSVIRDLDITFKFFMYHERSEGNLINDLKGFLLPYTGTINLLPTQIQYWQSLMQKIINDGYVTIRNTSYIPTPKGRIAYATPFKKYRTHAYKFQQIQKRVTFWFKFGFAAITLAATVFIAVYTYVIAIRTHG